MLFLSNMENLENTRIPYFRTLIGQDMQESLSPVGRWLNGVMREVDYGRMVADFRIREDMTNPARVLHGGAATAILDELIGVLVISLGGSMPIHPLT